MTEIPSVMQYIHSTCGQALFASITVLFWCVRRSTCCFPEVVVKAFCSLGQVFLETKILIFVKHVNKGVLEVVLRSPGKLSQLWTQNLMRSGGLTQADDTSPQIIAERRNFTLDPKRFGCFASSLSFQTWEPQLPK